MVGVFVFLLLCIGIEGQDDLRIHTTSGILKGKRGTVLDKPVKMFLGIPYATPPVGELRFKPPVPFESKDIERDSQNFSAICYQLPHSEEVINPLLKPNQAEISEDCLYLNIYIPDDSDTKDIEKLPVMVWLAGEGFNYADPVQFDGKYLSSEGKVILVTINYRVSVFGFLSALHDDAPGNVGLLDQRAALKWLKVNIGEFGGDSNRVTLFGRFTGAMSAAIHAFSPLSKEEILFHRIVLQSGVPDGTWIFDRNPLNGTLALAQATDCVYSTMAETIACFKRLSAEDLLKAAVLIPNAWRPIFDFSLIYEHTLKAAAKLNYHAIDILIGLNKDEGSLCLTALKAMKSEIFDKIMQNTVTREDFEILIENSMLDVYKKKDDFINKLASFLYSDSDDVDLRSKFVNFCGDLYVNAHSQKLADILSSVNRSVYIYELVHRPSFSNQPSFIQAAHGDDVLYSFGLPLSLQSLPEEEAILTKQIIGTFSNFAYYGNPNFENSTAWPIYTTDNQLLMTFNITSNEDVQKSTYGRAVQFWHDIIPAAGSRICPLPPVTSALVDSEEHDQENGYFLGTWVTVPTAEYVMLGLGCVSVFLFAVAFVAVITMLKIKHHATFSRLK